MQLKIKHFIVNPDVPLNKPIYALTNSAHVEYYCTWLCYTYSHLCTLCLPKSSKTNVTM